jgi:hypothetical protein
MDPRLQTGHVETTTGLSMPRSGECVYKDEIGGTLFGVIKGNVLISCESMEAENGVTPLVESEATFTGDSGEGTAWTFLFDVPLEPSTCQAEYTQTFVRE